jgi:monovalent cation:H+ antiporter-2, CPA2 family
VGVAYLLARLSHLAARPMQLAIGLGQIGEFSFVLAALGLESGQLARPIYTAILAAVTVSIAVSTVIVRLPRAVPARSSREVAAR